MSILFLCLFVAAIGYAVWRWILSTPELPGQPEGVSYQAWKELLIACRNDQALALRLLSFELERPKALSQDDACRAASWRLMRDRA